MAWWECEIVDRACVQVTAPRDGVTRREIPVPATVEEQWTDLDYLVESQGEAHALHLLRRRGVSALQSESGAGYLCGVPGRADSFRGGHELGRPHHRRLGAGAVVCAGHG